MAIDSGMESNDAVAQPMHNEFAPDAVRSREKAINEEGRNELMAQHFCVVGMDVDKEKVTYAKNRMRRHLSTN